MDESSEVANQPGDQPNQSTQLVFNQQPAQNQTGPSVLQEPSCYIQLVVASQNQPAGVSQQTTALTINAPSHTTTPVLFATDGTTSDSSSQSQQPSTSTLLKGQLLPPLTSSSSSTDNAAALSTALRPVLRPLVEKALIERLWACNELGVGSPSSLLLTMWLYVSRQFGIGCRTDHAKLLFSNFAVSINPETGGRQLQFVPVVTVNGSSADPLHRVQPRFPNQLLPAQPNQPSRCPVELFTLYTSRRPVSATLANSPFYLQPYRSGSSSIGSSSSSKSSTPTKQWPWYSSNALGKNKIGSMLNLALQRIGMPISRQVNLSRFCDALIATAFSLEPGPWKSQLIALARAYSRDPSRGQPELTSCVETLVDCAVDGKSPLHTLLSTVATSNQKTVVSVTNGNNTTTNGTKLGVVSGVVKQNNDRLPISAVNLTSLEPRPVQPKPTLVRPLVVDNKAGPSEPMMITVDLDAEDHHHHNPPIAQHSQPNESLVNGCRVVYCNNNWSTDDLSKQGQASTTVMDNVSWSSTLQLQLQPNVVVDCNPSTVSQMGHDVVSLSTSLSTSTVTTTLWNQQQGIGGEFLSQDLSGQTVQSIQSQVPIPSTINFHNIDDSVPTSNTNIVDQTQLNIQQLCDDGSTPNHITSNMDKFLEFLLKLTEENCDQVTDHHSQLAGLVAQIFWRCRALDDRGPWILTFTMWWLLHHQFGITDRSHLINLKWGHLKLTTGLVDPMTDAPCEAIEYVGPADYITDKACALLEQQEGDLATAGVRRVYPSSSWAEPELVVALGLIDSGLSSPDLKLRPFSTHGVASLSRSGPNFVSLYKSFARHRQKSSNIAEAPLFVQPLSSSQSSSENKPRSVWFSSSALGKTRLGALMRNVINKMVRPNLSLAGDVSLEEARKACSTALQRALDASSPWLANEADQKLLGQRLTDLLGLESTNVVVDQDPSQPDNNKQEKPTGTESNAVASSLPPNSQQQLIVLPTLQSLVSSNNQLVQPQPSIQTIPAINNSKAINNIVLLHQQPGSSQPTPIPLIQSFIPTVASSSSSTTTCQPGFTRLVLLPTARQPGGGLQLVPTLNRQVPNNLMSNEPGEMGQLQTTTNTNQLQTSPYQSTQLNATNMAGKPISLIFIPSGQAVTPLVPQINQQSHQQYSIQPQQNPVIFPTQSAVATSNSNAALHLTPQYVQHHPQPIMMTDPLTSLVSSESVGSTERLPACSQLLFDNQSTVSGINGLSEPNTEVSEVITIEDDNETNHYYDQPMDVDSIQLTGPIVQNRQGELIQNQDYSTTTNTRSSSSTMQQQFQVVVSSQGSGQQSLNKMPIDCQSQLIRIVHHPASQQHQIYSFGTTETGAMVTDVDPTQNPSNPIVPVNSQIVLGRDLTSVHSTDFNNASLDSSTTSMPSSFPNWTPPEPCPDELRSLESVIKELCELQSSDFANHINQLLVKGLLSTRHPWCLNFTSWFINTVAFDVDNRTEHANLLWGDFQLGRTTSGAGVVDFVCFARRRPLDGAIVKWSYLAAASNSDANQGLEVNLEASDDQHSSGTILLPLPCPVLVFKTLQRYRPVNCREPFHKFYLQPRSTIDRDKHFSNPSNSCINISAAANTHCLTSWFSEHAWGKNKLGGLFAEAARLAGLPPLWLRKPRPRGTSTTMTPGSSSGVLSTGLADEAGGKRARLNADSPILSTTTTTKLNNNSPSSVGEIELNNRVLPIISSSDQTNPYVL